MIRLVVNGNRFEAARAAADRGIPLAFETESKTLGHTVGCAPDAARERVVAWYRETVAAPYPVGALLAHTDI